MEKNTITTMVNSINSMSVREFINYLNDIIPLSPNNIINLYKESIDGEAFLLMEKKHISELGLMDKYNKLCIFFPMATFVDNFLN